jgi:hypothetical protein
VEGLFAFTRKEKRVPWPCRPERRSADTHHVRHVAWIARQNASGLQTPNVGEYSAKEGALDDLAPAV